MSDQALFTSQTSLSNSASISETSDTLAPQEAKNGQPQPDSVRAKSSEEDGNSESSCSSANSSGNDSREASLTSAHAQRAQTTTDSGDHHFVASNNKISRRRKGTGRQQNKSGKLTSYDVHSQLSS